MQQKHKLLQKPNSGLSDDCERILNLAMEINLGDLLLFEKHNLFHNVIDLAYKLGCNKKLENNERNAKYMSNDRNLQDNFSERKGLRRTIYEH